MFHLNSVACGHRNFTSLCIEKSALQSATLPHLTDPTSIVCARHYSHKKTLITSFYKLIRPQLIYSIVCFFMLFTASTFDTAGVACVCVFPSCCSMFKMYANERAMSSCNDMEIKLMIEYFMMVCVLFCVVFNGDKTFMAVWI